MNLRHWGVEDRDLYLEFDLGFASGLEIEIENDGHLGGET